MIGQHGQDRAERYQGFQRPAGKAPDESLLEALS
jgi:hypothetical protein